MSNLPVILLMGPTASGKTALAMSLYDQLDTEIISVDSATIYRGMDIGTAKPSAEMLAAYPHALMDICDPLESYSAAQFRDDALALIKQAHSRGKIPMLVGGTMLYYKALMEGMADLPESVPEVRAEINALGLEHGWPYVHQLLAEVDPTSAQRLNPNDAQRVQRALEVYRISGETLTQHWARQQEQVPDFNAVSIAVMPEHRATLHERIEQRFDIMLAEGFEDEVRALKERGDLHLGLPSMRCVGYRQMWEYFEGVWDYDTMRFKGIVASRQLAKRQVTWLRSWPKLNWLATEDALILDKALKLVDSVVV